MRPKPELHRDANNNIGVFVRLTCNAYKWTALIVGALMVAVGAGTSEQELLMPIEEAKFTFAATSGNSTIATALLRSFPATHRELRLVTLGKGSTKKHKAPYEESVVVIKGALIHWTKGLPSAQTKRPSR